MSRLLIVAIAAKEQIDPTLLPKEEGEDNGSSKVAIQRRAGGGIA